MTSGAAIVTAQYRAGCPEDRQDGGYEAPLLAATSQATRCANNAASITQCSRSASFGGVQVAAVPSRLGHHLRLHVQVRLGKGFTAHSAHSAVKSTPENVRMPISENAGVEPVGTGGKLCKNR